MSENISTISVAYGDGIGPEIMQAVLHVLAEARAALEVEIVDIGERAFRRDIQTGIAGQAWESIHRNGMLLRGPVVAPPHPLLPSVSLHLTQRLGLWARVLRLQRWNGETKQMQSITLVHSLSDELPCLPEYHPEEDSFLSHHALGRHETSFLLRVALAHAAYYQIEGVTCVSDVRHSQLVEGMRLRLCELLSADYPTLSLDHASPEAVMRAILDCDGSFSAHTMLVTNAATARLLLPVLQHAFADGRMSAGMDVGEDFAVSYPLHGISEGLTEKDSTNPAAILQASLLMMDWLGQHECAQTVHNAWMKTWEDGVFTADMMDEPQGGEPSTLDDFAEAVIARFGKKPSRSQRFHLVKGVEYPPEPGRILTPVTDQTVDGVDVLVESSEPPAALAVKLKNLLSKTMVLSHVRQGNTVWYPEDLSRALYSISETARLLGCRIVAAEGASFSPVQVGELIHALADAGIPTVGHMLLHSYDGVKGYLEPNTVFVS